MSSGRLPPNRIIDYALSLLRREKTITINVASTANPIVLAASQGDNVEYSGTRAKWGT